MGKSWACKLNSGRTATGAPDEDGIFAISIPHGNDSAVMNLDSDAAYELGRALIEWAMSERPQDLADQTFRFRQLLDELNDLAVALAAQKKEKE